MTNGVFKPYIFARFRAVDNINEDAIMCTSSTPISYVNFVNMWALLKHSFC